MNQYEFVIVLVLVVGVISILRRRMGVRHVWERPIEDDSREKQQLREEVQQLKERLKVLERIAVDKENSLARQIDELRDR